MKKHIKYLKKLEACSEAVEWAEQYKSLQETWDNCKRGDWMLWLLGKQSGEPGTKSRKKLVLTCCKCARTALKYVPKGEEIPLKAIEAAEDYANGINGVTLDDVKSASSASSAYAYPSAYAYAAYASAYAYAYASSASYAAYASAAAASTAAAYAAAAANYAAGVGYYGERQWLAGRLMEYLNGEVEC